MREANVSGMPLEYRDDAMESEPPQPAAERNPPGFWKTTFSFTAVWVLAEVLLGLVVAFFVLDWTGGASDGKSETILTHPYLITVAMPVSAIVGTLLVLLIASRWSSVDAVLPLKRPAAGQMLLWLAGAFALVGALTLAGLLLDLDRPEIPQWWVDIYTASAMPLLLIFAVSFVVPVFEEVLIRGLLFAGWSRSRLGVAGTILLTAALWTALHAQYDNAYDLGQIFAFGILLGCARHRTGSLFVPIILHMANNLAACVQTVYLLPS